MIVNPDGSVEEYAKLLVGMSNRVTQLERAVSNSGGGAPTGSFIMGGWATAPDGYLFLDGSTITNGATLYPTLASMFPAWVSGANLILPNATGAVPLAAATAGVVSGSMTHTAVASHSHGIGTHSHGVGSHGHTASSSGSVSIGSDSHTHSYVTPTGSAGAASGTAVNARIGAGGSTSGSTSHSHTGSISVSTSVGSTSLSTDSASLSTGGAGSSAVDHTPRNLTVRMAVKT